MFFLYGWQDKAIEWLDRISKTLGYGRQLRGFSEADWYADKVFLTLISPLCLCTNNVLLVLFSLTDEIELGFWFVVVAGNSYLLVLQVWKVIKVQNKLAV